MLVLTCQMGRHPDGQLGRHPDDPFGIGLGVRSDTKNVHSLCIRLNDAKFVVSDFPL